MRGRARQTTRAHLQQLCPSRLRARLGREQDEVQDTYHKQFQATGINFSASNFALAVL